MPDAALDSLLAADEPPPFEVFNPGGRPDTLLLCDHASRRVPRALGDLGAPRDAFERHIAWDIGAAAVGRHLARLLDAPLVLSGYSRLVIDLNRRIDDPTSIPELSDGTEIPGNRALAPSQRQLRIRALFEPYHDAVAGIIARARAAAVVPAPVSIHSCTPVFCGRARPWHVGVLWNRDGRVARPLMDALAAVPGVVVGDNQPYSARDGHGHTMWRHAELPGLPHVLIELRQDLIEAEDGAAAWARTLHDALAPILARADLRRAVTG